MKRFFSGLFAALVVVLSAAPFLYVFVRSFLSPGGVTFQRQLEEAAYSCAGGKIPVQPYGHFRENRISKGLRHGTHQY